MDEVSNKTLATLLVVAIVISLAGTFFAMRGVSQITNIVTGASVTPSGTAKVNITELTSIVLTQSLVDFGAGFRNTSVVTVNQECNLTTNDTTLGQIGSSDCWINQTEYAPKPFTLENDGNNYVEVSINSSTAVNFLTGTPTAGTQHYLFSPADSNDGFFKPAENGCLVAFTGTETWTEFSESNQTICTNMSPYTAEDEFNVDINISIPAGILGEKTTSVTFYAIKSAQ